MMMLMVVVVMIMIMDNFYWNHLLQANQSARHPAFIIFNSHNSTEINISIIISDEAPNA